MLLESFLMVTTKKRGKLIVIEGTDGSGKTTQYKLLLRRLKQEKIPFARLDFPQYEKPSSYFIRKYLNGDYGGWEKVGPYRASIFYALDRFDVKPKIEQWLHEGKTVIADRYVASNMGHQGAQIASSKERKAYFRWLHKLEYQILGIPRPDMTIVLHVPGTFVKKMIDKRRRISGIQGGMKRDILEADLKHLHQAERVYKETVKLFPRDFRMIECMKGKKFAGMEEIHEKVWTMVSGVIRA